MSTPSDLTCETLRKIEAVGASLEIRTRWLCEDVGRLVHLPDWETKAEDQLVRAEQQAARALTAIQLARSLMLAQRTKAMEAAE